MGIFPPEEKELEEPFELLYKNCLFKVQARNHWEGGVYGKVTFLRYEGRLQIEKTTHEAIKKEVEDAGEMYRRSPNYGGLSLADFLAKMLPDI